MCVCWCRGVKFSAEEERTVIDLQAQFGNKWAKIATYLAGRTDNDVKNFWSSRQKRLARILQTSTPSSSKSLKVIPFSAFSSTHHQNLTPSFNPQVPKLLVHNHHDALETPVHPSPVLYDHSAIPLAYLPPEQDPPHISFPLLQPDYPLLMDSQDFIGRLGVPSFLEDDFNHSHRSALGTAQVPILPSFCAQGSSRVSSHDTEDIGSLIDDFPPIDLFDQIEQLPSPSEWS